MEKVPYSKYSKEFRLEAVRLVTEGGLSVGEGAMRLSLPKSTLENWVRAFKAGKLESIGSTHRPLTEVEVELALRSLFRHRTNSQTGGYFCEYVFGPMVFPQGDHPLGRTASCVFR